jgi:hypothetical protein
MMGVAAAPWILPRVATTPGVYDARKALGWACFFFGTIMLTLVTIAVFMRDYLMRAAGASIAAPPEWLRSLVTMRLAEISTRGIVGKVGLRRRRAVRLSPNSGDIELVTPQRRLPLERESGIDVFAVGIAFRREISKGRRTFERIAVLRFFLLSKRAARRRKRKNRENRPDTHDEITPLHAGDE